MQDKEKSTEQCKAGLQPKQCKADLQKGTCKADLHEQLTWRRIFTPVHIPKYLVEQIKSRDFTVDQFYKNQEEACICIDSQGNQSISPLNHLYVLSDEGFKVVGFLWFVIDDMCQSIIVQNFSVDRKYWGKGKALELASRHIKEILKNAKLKKVYWVTNRPKVFEKAGFVRAKDTIMEWSPEGENHGEIVNGGKQDQRNPKQSDTGAKAVSQ